MEKKKWLWKRKSSERSPGETESSGSISSHSEKFLDDQDMSKTPVNDSTQSPEVTSKSNERDDDCNDIIKSLTERLSAALVNISAKDDLVKQHSKVAEEAVAGWEKAENEVATLRKQLVAAIQQKSALEDRVSHLDGALKECVRQLRLARDEQEEKVNEAIAKKTSEWESTKAELENQLLEAQMKANALSESPVKIDAELLHKLESLEQENASLKLELLTHLEELELRTIERDLSTHAAETASKQHLDSIKKVAKLEAECRRLKVMVSRSSSPNDHKNSAASSVYVESLTDSQSDSGERLSFVDLDTSKMNGNEPSKLIAELDQLRYEKGRNPNFPASAIEIDLMDDFLEMERLAALPETGNGIPDSEPAAVVRESKDAELLLKAELKSMIQRMGELEAKVKEMECEKVELEQQLEKMRAEKIELEIALTKSHDESVASQLQLREAQLELEDLQRKLSSAYESKQLIESQFISLEAEARTMSEKVKFLEEEVEKERVLSAGITSQSEKLKEELARTKQEAELWQTAKLNSAPKIKEEDLALAAGKLAECQKTIFSLGKQLKSLATLEDFLVDANLPEFSAKGSLLPAASGEHWKLHSNETFSPRMDSSETAIISANKNEGNSPPSSSLSASSSILPNHVSSEKNRNGFSKFFSRSKNGIQLDI